ncbi:MAG: hypothetical protein RLY61_559 [Candidatus Parcubacteria bacterium]|jgi:hypothetical protein
MPEILIKYPDPRDNTMVVREPGELENGGVTFVIREDSIAAKVGDTPVPVEYRVREDGVIVINAPQQRS